MQEGHILETHNDVPENVREELYAEEQKFAREASKGFWDVYSNPSCHSYYKYTAPTGWSTSHLASLAGAQVPDMPSKT